MLHLNSSNLPENTKHVRLNDYNVCLNESNSMNKSNSTYTINLATIFDYFKGNFLLLFQPKNSYHFWTLYVSNKTKMP